MNVEALLVEAERAGARVVDRGNGHIQIFGKLLVNYYPLSKRRSAYVAGTVGAKHHVDAQQAISMAFEAPPVTKAKDRRSKHTRLIRSKLLKRYKLCRWCARPLTLDDSTIEHIIPIARGGLDNDNNRTLACESCNKARGHDMPELDEAARRGA